MSIPPSESGKHTPVASSVAGDDSFDLVDLVRPVRSHLLRIVAGALFSGVVAIGLSFLVSPVFTATTSFLPPQQQQSAAAGALASLGSLAGLAAGAAGIRNPIDQYVSLVQSTTVRDRLIDHFKLMDIYQETLRTDARAVLARNVRVSAGKRDGIITIEVDDTNPQRAADIANHHVAELREMLGRLALTEAQQRRAFFERQLEQVRAKLAAAQSALQGSGFNANVLRAEPKAAAETYARLKAELTNAEVRLSGMRGRFTDSAPEIQQQASMAASLRSRLVESEAASTSQVDPGYLSKYREFKYQETLFEVFSRQYEVARVDESRESAAIQVIDAATPPEKKSRPKRSVVGVLTSLSVGMVLVAWVILSDRRKRRDVEAARAADPGAPSAA